MRWATLLIPIALIRGDISYHPNLYEVGSSQDRCCNNYCISEVKTSKPELVVRKINTSNSLSVYFEEDSNILSAKSIRDIQLFLEKNKEVSDITVIGNTDGCGAPTYNVNLSGKRASAVKKEILKDKKRTVKTRWSGEIVSNHSPSARRVDIVATSKITLSEPLPKLIADFYLLDASGSMSGGDWQKYVRAISFHRPRGSRVFVSTTQCVSSYSHLNLLNPSGGTEIWMAYWRIIDYMSPGQTLMIISDFNSTVPLQPWENQAISNKLSKKNIIVKVVRL